MPEAHTPHLAPPHPSPLGRLPHREPFVFLTSIEELTMGKSGSGTWKVTGAEDFFRGHFPGAPVVPGVLIGEALAQLAGLVGLHTDSQAGGTHQETQRGGRLVHIDVRFDRPVTPPAEIGLRVAMMRELGPLRQFEVSAEAAGVRVARGMLTLAQVVEGEPR